MKEKDNDKELEFVLQHYEAQRFDPEEAMRRLQPATPKRRYRWIAVAASLLCLTVMAAVFVWREVVPSAPAAVEVPAAVTQPADVHTPASFHFDATPLPEVLAALEQHYGVELTASDTTHQLTGSFSGQSLEDILSMIEEVLDVDISQDGTE